MDCRRGSVGACVGRPDARGVEAQPQRLKPKSRRVAIGTTKVVPFPGRPCPGRALENGTKKVVCPRLDASRFPQRKKPGIPETKQVRIISTGKGTSSTRAELGSVELRLPAAEVGREAHPSHLSTWHLLRDPLNLAMQKAFRRGVLRPTVLEDCL
jgi:hypothetical protein